MADNPKQDQNQERNPFDDLGGSFDLDETKRQTEQAKAKAEHLDYLIHRVFQQSEEGRELLGIWTENLIYAPCAEPGMDQVEIGIREGIKRFIRNIKLTVKKVEKG